MAAFIPIEIITASSTFEIELEDGVFNFRVYFSDISNLWIMDLDRNGEEIARGVALVLGQDLLLPFNPNIGAWAMIDFNNKELDATRDTLGSQVGLLYVSSEELSGEAVLAETT